MVNRERSAEELFEAALELPPERRAAFLDLSCGSTPDLRPLVDALLADNERMGSFLEKPLLGARESDVGGAVKSPLANVMTGRFQPHDVIANRFEVVRFIARGGMGEVYEVRDRYLRGVPVALKIIRPEIAGDVGSTQRFEQEVILARKVAHPNLCTIYDLSRCEQPAPPFLFLTMKLLAGETLDCRLKRERIGTGEGVEICRQLLRGMAALHEADIVHRDIKPGNIMLEQTPGSKGGICVSLMDFGLARLHHSDSLTANSVTIAGTLGYMAPELLRGQPPTKASDLFALGVVMHQVLTGERPVESVTSHSSEWALAATPALRSTNAPPALVEAVEGFLVANSETRYRAFDAIQSAESGLLVAKKAPRTGALSTKAAWYTTVSLLAIALIWLAVKLTAPPLPRLLPSQQITFSPDPKARPLLTDGSRLYFQSRGMPSAMSVNGGMIAPIPGFGKGFEVRAVSPDGSQVMAIKPDADDYPFHGPLWVASSLGGLPRRIGSYSAQDARWSPDGKTIAIAEGGNIYVANADGSNARKIWAASGTVDSLGFSPDGRELTLAVITKESSREWRVNIDGSDPHPLAFKWTPVSDQWFGQWTPNGKHFVFLSDRENGGEVYEVVKPRWFEFWKKPTPVLITGTDLMILGLAPGRDGESLYVLGQLDQGAMQVLDLSSGKYIPFLDGLNMIAFQVSPDRQWMAYTEYPTGNLIKSRLDGTEPLQLTTTLGVMQQWSPDSTSLVYSDTNDLYTISAEGGSPQKLVQAPANEHAMAPTWAPDGKSIAFTFHNYLGRPIGGIQVVNMATRKATVMPGSENFADPIWTPNGRFLIASANDKSRMMLYAVDTGAWKELRRFDAPLLTWALSPDGQCLFLRFMGAGDGIYRLGIPDAKWERVSGTEGVSRREGEGWLSVTADGRPAIMSHTSMAQVYALRWEH